MNSSVRHLQDDDGDVDLQKLYPALVETFVIILCGYAAGRLKLITQQESKGLNVFVSSFSLPSVIFLSLAQLDLSSVNWLFLASILVSKTVVFLAVVIVTFCLNRPLHYGKPGLFAIFCTQSNDFAIGYPILDALYSKSHPDYPLYLYLMAPISLAILNPIAFVLMELGKRQERRKSLQDDEIAESNLNAVDERTQPSVTGPPTQQTNTNANSITQQRLKFVAAILKSIVTNPVVFMTALGIIGNSFFKYIGPVQGILKVLGSAFSGTALFVLGLRMVGTVEKLKGGALLIPGILICIKLLVLPLVTREVVSLLHTGSNASETLDLSTFGFLYGTFPTAPAVFVFSTQYNLEVDLISSSMVACTFISAPLMFISAKMTSFDKTNPDNHMKDLNSYACDISIPGLFLGAWMVLLFVVHKWYTKLPHKVTACLIVSQIIINIGMVLQPLTDHSKAWSLYLQFAILSFGVYSSRLWSSYLAVTLVLLQSRSLCFVLKLMPFFFITGWGIPLILVIVVAVVASYEVAPTSATSIGPIFQYGTFQAAVTLFLLVVCFLVTSGCLILQQRYRRRYARYLLLVQEVNSKDLAEVVPKEEEEGQTEDDNQIDEPGPSNHALLNGGNTNVRLRQVVDIEEIVSNSGSLTYQASNTDACGHHGDLCSSRFGCTERQREACEANVKEYNEQVERGDDEEEGGIGREEEEDILQLDGADIIQRSEMQILRHIVLLLLIVTSMFIGIMLSIWTIVVEDLFSGIYVELAFLDVTLTIGQIFLTFGVFGLDAKVILSPLANWWRKWHYGQNKIVLTSLENLSFETTHVCHQFIAHHQETCTKEIAKNCRVRLTLHQDSFKGSALVSWLVKTRLAKDRIDGTQYAYLLLEGRVIRHIHDLHHFSDSNLLYTFRFN